MILTYDAIDSAGCRSNDTVEAGSTSDAIQILRQRGLLVTNISEKTETKWGHTAAVRSSRGVRLPLKTLALFTRQMAMLLRAGSGVVPAMTAIKRQMRRPQQADLLGQIVDDLEEGSTLTDSLRKHTNTFDPFFCAIVAAGEASGALADMFERLSRIVGTRRALRNKFAGALTYPLLLSVMCVHILLVLLLFVLPRFGNMFAQLGVDPPSTTKALLTVSGMIRQYWPGLLGGVVGLVIATIWIASTTRGKQWMSNIQIRVPIFGPLRSQMIQAQIFRTLGTLLESRVGLLETLDLARESTRNNRFQELFDNLHNTVSSGGQLATAFETSDLIPAHVSQAIRTGEDSGSLGEALIFCADILDETNTELTNVVTRLIEPVILIGMGLVVGGVAIALFLPLFDLTSAIR